MKENEPNFYYDLFNAYRSLNDKDNQIKYLKKAILLKVNYWQAYQALGGVYFEEGNLIMAKEMIEKAIQFGSPDVQVLEQYISKIDKSLDKIQ